LKNDCTELASGRIVLPNFTCAIPKKVLFCVLDKICNAAETNHVVRLMLENFVNKLVKGIDVDQSNDKHSDRNHEQGDFVRLLPTHDSIVYKTKDNTDSRSKDISSEQGDSNNKIVELDGLNSPTLFGESEDFTNSSYDDNDFKYSDIFDEHGEVLADPLWSTPDPRDMFV